MRRWMIVLLLGFLFGLVAGWTAAIGLAEIVAEDQDKKVILTDWRPEIPHCDKELWKRITEGCDVP